MKKKNLKSGFSIFIAIIVTSVLLIISFSIANIATKQTQFSNINKESQYASFAADAGIECALYWDTKFNYFSTSTAGTISCNGSSNITTGSQSPISGTTTVSRVGGGTDANPMSVFGFSLNSASNPTNACVIVAVYKYYSGVNLMTHVYAYGYNNCNTSDPRRVERGIEVLY
jgi:hypothetical protein